MQSEMTAFFVYCDIYKKNSVYMRMISENRINQIISEEISKTDVEGIVSRKLSSSYGSKEFEKKVKDIVADAIEDLFRSLYNRSSMWKGSITR